MTSSGGLKGRQLYIRDLGQAVARPLLGTERGRIPFFDPDGEWVGYQDNAYILRKVSVRGGAPVTICSLSGDAAGASWGTDDTILFGSRSGGLHRVSAAGGDPEVLTTPDVEQGEIGHVWPHVLPDGRAVLFTVLTPDQSESRHIALLSMATGEHKRLITGGTHPRYLPTGHVLYGVEGTLRAVPFDLESLEVTGAPVPVVENVMMKDSGAANFAVARNGTLVYVVWDLRPSGLGAGNC